GPARRRARARAGRGLPVRGPRGLTLAEARLIVPRHHGTTAPRPSDDMYPFDGSDLGSGPGRADVPRPRPTDSSDAPCPLAASACPDGPETSGLRRVCAPGTHDRAPRAVPATTGRTIPLALTDHELAASLARGAGEVLLAERAAVGASDYDGRALKDRGDRAAHEFLVRALAHVRPDDAVPSAEG